MLPAPLSVYQERLALVQEDLRKRGLSGVLLFDPENLFWLTGYETIGYFTFHATYIAVDRAPVIIARVVNRDLALSYPTIAGFEAIVDTADPVNLLTSYLASAAAEQAVGIETASRQLSVADHTRLSEQAPCRLVDWNGVIETRRPIKSDWEIERMRDAARAAESGLRAAIDEVAPGKTENDIAAAMLDGSIRAGSEYLGHPPLIVAGPTTALCFAMWRRRTVAPGDVVLLEAAGCVGRLHAMLSRPVVVGKPTDEHVEAADALQGVLEAAIEAIKPGLTAGEVDERCRRVVEQRGLGDFFRHRAAYGIGIGFPPNWSEGHIYAIRPGDPLVLQANMTFHVIPTLFKKTFGMCFSDSVRVTEDGCELLTNFPRRLFTVDA
ncbi:MAG: Xaa-Pro peptidase family protein [Alphaproteobacteria bacterium]|nr:Xaa-Pro peptidase family protein [Alphaproteobacteria bacterium]